MRAKSVADSPFLRHLPRLAGGLIAALGSVVILAWYAHWTEVLQVLPQFTPMKFNTALGFVFCGAGLVLMTTRHARVAPWLGGLAGILGMLTWAEYLTRANLGIDQWFVSDYLRAATNFPGRMSPLTAICFSCNGLALLFFSLKPEGMWRVICASLLASMAAMFVSFSLFCYVFGIQSGYGWGDEAQMAIHTVVAFLVLGAGMFVRAWQVEPTENFIFLRWLPVAASVLLMFMIAFFSAESFWQLEQSADWRKHTVQVILAAQSFQETCLEIARGTHDYAVTGDANALAAYKAGMAREPAQFERLVELTRDDPVQQSRLQNLAAEVQASLAGDARLISQYQQRAAKPAFKADAAGQGGMISGREYDTLAAFSQEEQRLLDLREDTEKAGFHNTARLLACGSVLAAALLLLANGIARRELVFRRRAEARLARQAAALQRSNTELEQFAYVASHDMQEPLRAVSGFAKILQRRCRDQLDQESTEMIGHIQDGAKRMSAIIDDLLALSHIGSQGKPFEKTELEKPLAQALENLAVAIAERQAVIRHESLPTLPVDSSQLSLLFQNLLANAIKFCRDRPPEIHIGATKEAGGFWRISVRDNGIGVQPKYFERIFRMFQRLHTRTEYPGTGIGLAICKKIVERHGGRIWPEANAGEGTTFHFTLPERPAEMKP